MFKFFRQVRRQLIAEQNAVRYIQYAVGEIVLVVLGILIALQINTWNNDRLDRKEEQIYLTRFVQDLEQDVSNIQVAIRNHQKRLILGLHVLQQMGSSNTDQILSWDAYQKALNNQSRYAEHLQLPFTGKLFEILKIDLFHLTDDTFQELLSIGKIDIIRDRELKAAIQSHYPQIRQMQSFQDRIVFNVQSKYRDAMQNNRISYLDKIDYATFRRSDVDEKELRSIIENFMSLSSGFLGTLYLHQDSMQNMTKELIKKIEKEIR